MRINRFINRGRLTRGLSFILIILILAIHFFLSMTAVHKEIDATEFNEKLIIPSNKYKAIDITFQEGEELEIIFMI